ncbi:MAG: hypothetical protein ACERKJ_11880, partial [Candidatus Dadabacteria bacterium]
MYDAIVNSYVSSIGRGVDTYTKLLLHMNGTDESTTITDSGSTGHTVTAEDNAQIDTAVYKFDNASCLFDGTDDYLSVPDHADWNFGSGLFTIDLWFKLAADQAGYFYKQYIDATHQIYIDFVTAPSDIVRFYMVNG